MYVSLEEHESKLICLLDPWFGDIDAPGAWHRAWLIDIQHRTTVLMVGTARQYHASEPADRVFRVSSVSLI